MAKTWGYALSGFASGLSTGFSMRMEKAKIDALKEEQEKLEKSKANAEKIFNEWYLDPKTKEFCANLDTASQGERTYFVSGLLGISKDLFNYFTEIDNDIRDGNVAEAKRKNDLVIQKIKSMTDLAKLGMVATFPDGSPMKIPPEDIEFQRQIQIGKMAGGPTGEAMGREMWRERGLGEITPTPKVPGITDYKGAADYLSKFAQTASPETFEKIRAGLQKQFPNIDLSAITQESLREPIAPEPTPAPTSTENVRKAISDADTVKDAQRIYENYADKYDEKALDIPEGGIDRFWAESQIPYLNNIKTAIGNIIDEKGWLKKGTLTSTEVGIDFKGEQSVEEIYEKLRKEYMKYRSMLEKLGVDISQFPELKPLEEIEKVGLGEGFWGWGKQRGQYKSIYK